MYLTLRFRRIAVLLMPAALAVCYSQSGDQVALGNTSGASNGLLVSGQFGAAPTAYKSFHGTPGTIGVGDVAASAGLDEVVAFTLRRPVAIQTPATWTGGADTASLSYANEIAIPVTVWVVKGPYATRRKKARSLSLATTTILRKERMGVAFSSFDIVDATGFANANAYFTFNCLKKPNLLRDIPPAANRVNVYIVNTVNGSTGEGDSCRIGGDFVALGKSVGAELLAHELGHGFGLEHIDGLADFDETNVMHSASDTRSYFSEGQTFRAHFTPSSSLNAVYAKRPGQPTRDCSDASNPCPELRKRIWGDGAGFPAN